MYIIILALERIFNVSIIIRRYLDMDDTEEFIEECDDTLEDYA
jgi:hypothetical protein